jgi:hypothetical protein
VVGLGVALLLVPLPVARPEMAWTSAIPEASPAKNVALAVPFEVCASTGSTRPSVVMNLTVVPLGTGDPLFSSTVADSVADPPRGRTRFDTVSVMREFVGARSGAESQATWAAQAVRTAAHTRRTSN